MGWNALANTGNPTRSVEVNNLIKKVKKEEVRKQGKPSNAKRPLEQREFRSILRILEQKNDFSCKYRMTTMAKFQYNMVARADDTANFETDELKENAEFPFALLCRMCWSKNVFEERDAPDQILLGAMDTDFCILLALSIYLEHWMAVGDGIHSRFLFSDSNDDTASKCIKDSYRNVLKNEVYNSNEFERARSGPLGSSPRHKLVAMAVVVMILTVADDGEIRKGSLTDTLM